MDEPEREQSEWWCEEWICVSDTDKWPPSPLEAISNVVVNAKKEIQCARKKLFILCSSLPSHPDPLFSGLICRQNCSTFSHSFVMAARRHNNGSFEKCDTVLESLILRNGWHMHMVFSSYKSASWQISRKARTINGADDVKHSISKKPRLSALWKMLRLFLPIRVKQTKLEYYLCTTLHCWSLECLILNRQDENLGKVFRLKIKCCHLSSASSLSANFLKDSLVSAAAGEYRYGWQSNGFFSQGQKQINFSKEQHPLR